MKHFLNSIFLLFTIFLLSCATNSEPQKEVVSSAQEKEVGPITLVIHGGAGTILKENMTPEKEQAYNEKLSEALDAGYEVLENGGTSLEAITTAIQIMEESPLFNAGKGAVFTNQGRNELDASIMDGATGKAGAVAGVTIVKSPILAAQAVMNNSPHVMMAGTGAEQFAKEQGLEIVDSSYFYTERRFKALENIKQKELEQSAYLFENPDYKYGTVGAVALDKNGNIAAGTSTGGMTNKRYGRIGDSPVIGAGTFAENESCGVSATGHGEFFIRNVVAYDIAARMKYQDMSLNDAANEVIMNKLVEKGGTGGIVALDRQGNVAMTFNTPGMYRGYIKEKGQPVVKIYQD